MTHSRRSVLAAVAGLLAVPKAVSAALPNRDYQAPLSYNFGDANIMGRKLVVSEVSDDGKSITLRPALRFEVNKFPVDQDGNENRQYLRLQNRCVVMLNGEKCDRVIIADEIKGEIVRYVRAQQRSGELLIRDGECVSETVYGHVVVKPHAI